MGSRTWSLTILGALLIGTPTAYFLGRALGDAVVEAAQQVCANSKASPDDVEDRTQENSSEVSAAKAVGWRNFWRDPTMASGVAVAFFTLGLLGVAFLEIVLLIISLVTSIEAVTQAREASLAARQSMEMYANTERGWAKVGGMGVGYVEGRAVVMFSIENIGRGPLVIRGDTIKARYLPKEERAPLPNASESYQRTFVLLGSRGEIVTWLKEGSQYREPEFIEGQTGDSGKEDILFQGCIHYESAFGTKHVCGFTYLFPDDDVDGSFKVVEDAGYNFDVPDTNALSAST